ncbi:MAG TPA: hypothetical protein ENK52_05040 [Saprospiraceae bacterium]|nr:hypothetical protein [Saprospiraceae bacterium]
MLQRDYIERLTQQIAELIAKMMGFETKEKLAFIDKAFDEWLRLDPKELEIIPKEELLFFLIQKKKFNIHQLELLAEILAKQGETFFIDQQLLKAKNQLEKSLIIFEEVENKQQLYSIQRQKTLHQIHQLLNKINNNLSAE